MTLKWAEMTPRERDALVAEKVMGTVVYCRTRYTKRVLLDVEKGDDWWPHYTTDIAAAWEVVEKLAEQNSGDLSVSIYQRKTFQPLWRCTITDSTFKQHVVYEHLSAPEAICLAALKAVGVDVE